MKESIRSKLDSDGYVVLEDFLSEKEVDELKDEIQILIGNMPDQAQRTIFSGKEADNQQNKATYFLESADKIGYFFDAGAVGRDGGLLTRTPRASLNKIAHALHEHDPVFRRATTSERVKEAAFQLGFEEPLVVQSMYIFKNPGKDAEVKPHQDASYLYTEPVSVVGFWIALEDATIENGCLWFARGSHRSGVHRRYRRNRDPASPELLVYDSPAPVYQKSSFEPVSVTKGTCILIHGQVVHFSEANRSSRSRDAYTFHVIEGKGTTYPEDNWLQLPPNKTFLNLYKN
ncbi:phytanoyl-CoA dioxygenase domain-containing protein 1 [Cylas formicarius]|uniref:phytanoyl-CoA dioxygenase domain-containing protein 1 n=1 Tax=Cylas formicarius TaxID=197179 RepID=UPI00295850F9|nr:phytanoyl-CoA dioxygenase domain-containing protein 1 [Cylas formicarius]